MDSVQAALRSRTAIQALFAFQYILGIAGIPILIEGVRVLAGTTWDMPPFTRAEELRMKYSVGSVIVVFDPITVKRIQSLIPYLNVHALEP